MVPPFSIPCIDCLLSAVASFMVNTFSGGQQESIQLLEGYEIEIVDVTPSRGLRIIRRVDYIGLFDETDLKGD